MDGPYEQYDSPRLPHPAAQKTYQNSSCTACKHMLEIPRMWNRTVTAAGPKWSGRDKVLRKSGHGLYPGPSKSWIGKDP